MPSFQWITHKGKRILYADIASQKTEELLDIVERLKPVIEKEPPNSVLCICDVTDGKTNTEMMNALKEFAKYIDPYMKYTDSDIYIGKKTVDIKWSQYDSKIEEGTFLGNVSKAIVLRGSYQINNDLTKVKHIVVIDDHNALMKHKVVVREMGIDKLFNI